MNTNLKTTLKAWPVITIWTIGLCFLTKTVAEQFGIDLPDQQNVEVLRQYLLSAFDSPRHFLASSLLLAQVLILLPAIEEIVFRLPTRWLRSHTWWTVFSAAFSAAHYIFQPFPDAAFIALFCFGLAQCLLYKKTGQIWCTMLSHALFNLTNVVLMLVIPA